VAEPVDTDRLADALRQWLADELDADAVEVRGLRRLSGGSSRENWAFSLYGPGGERPMLLRRDPVASVANTDRALEVGVIEALRGGTIPGPVIAAVDLTGRRLERPSVVMERSPGRAHRAVLRERDPLRLGLEGRLALAGSLADLLADVHAIEPTDRYRDALGHPPDDAASAEILRWEAEVERVKVEPQPELVYVAGWLWEHRPAPPERTVVVHGDFRPANVLVEDGRVTALLDWEFAHLGDPAEDLGWYTAPIYAGEHLIRDRWDACDFLARYRDRLGVGATDLAPDRLHFWQVLAAFKLGAIALAGVAGFLEGDTDRAAGPVADVLRSVVAATRSGPGGAR
jgi:aminoglycoside phosphotransferase (APT) family kinase protein